MPLAGETELSLPASGGRCRAGSGTKHSTNGLLATRSTVWSASRFMLRHRPVQRPMLASSPTGVSVVVVIMDIVMQACIRSLLGMVLYEIIGRIVLAVSPQIMDLRGELVRTVRVAQPSQIFSVSRNLSPLMTGLAVRRGDMGPGAIAWTVTTASTAANTMRVHKYLLSLPPNTRLCSRHVSTECLTDRTTELRAAFTASIRNC
jgi:hypothetical protein